MIFFRMLSEEEANERLEDADEDNNGIVTWQEYLSDAYGIDDEENLSIEDENEHVCKINYLNHCSSVLICS